MEQRLDLVPEPVQETKDEVVKVQEPDALTHSGQELIQLIERLELPELCLEERLIIVGQLREVTKESQTQKGF